MSIRRSRLFVVLVTLGLAFVPGRGSIVARQLAPTAHPTLPSTASDLWLVPSDTDRASRTTASFQPLVDGVARYQDGDYAAALALVTRPSLTTTDLAMYGVFYAGVAELRMSRTADARRTFESLLERQPQGYLAVAAGIGAAEGAEASGDRAAAVRIYERLAQDKAAVSDDILSRLGRAALAAGDRRRAAEAFARVYYEFPLTDAAIAAAQQ